MSSAPHGIRVLMIDDDATFRNVMSAELRRRGYLVDTRASGREAVDPAASAEVDVVLLDLRLPDMDGYSVCRALRHVDKKVPIVFVTAKGDLKDYTAGREAGAQARLAEAESMASQQMDEADRYALEMLKKLWNGGIKVARICSDSDSREAGLA